LYLSKRTVEQQLKLFVNLHNIHNFMFPVLWDKIKVTQKSVTVDS
jgi:hypothetical protein